MCRHRPWLSQLIFKSIVSQPPAAHSVSLSFALSALFSCVLAYVVVKKIATLTAIFIYLKADLEDDEVEEKIDQGKIYPFMLVSFTCMLYLFCLISP
jgi:hypothetical protein